MTPKSSYDVKQNQPTNQPTKQSMAYYISCLLLHDVLHHIHIIRSTHYVLHDPELHCLYITRSLITFHIYRSITYYINTYYTMT